MVVKERSQKLGFDREHSRRSEDDVFAPLVAGLLAGKDEAEVLEDLREAVKSLGVRKPSRLFRMRTKPPFGQKPSRVVGGQAQSGIRGLRPHGLPSQGTGVGTRRSCASRAQLAASASGLRALFEEEHCIIYVAITRAKRLWSAVRSSNTKGTISRSTCKPGSRPCWPSMQRAMRAVRARADLKRLHVVERSDLLVLVSSASVTHPVCRPISYSTNAGAGRGYRIVQEEAVALAPGVRHVPSGRWPRRSVPSAEQPVD